MAKVSENNDEGLRTLIRLVPPARALKEELEKSIHLELYAGTGDLAVKSFQGLQVNVAKIVDDSYVDALSLSAPKEATDKEKVSLALMAIGQLVAYLEGQIGLVGSGGGHRASHVLSHHTLSDVSPGKMICITKKAVMGEEGEEEVEEDIEVKDLNDLK